MSLPKELYYVVIAPGQWTSPDKYGNVFGGRPSQKPGSKTYATLRNAEFYLEDVRKRGLKAELFSTGPVQWQQLSDTRSIDGQINLW